MSNSATDVQEWRIIDINHDGTSGTVDLISKYVLCEGTGSGYWGMNNRYTTSDYTFGESAYDLSTIGYRGDIYKKTYEKGYVRKWINGAFLQGFDADIQNSLKTMAVQISQYDWWYGNSNFYDSYYLYDKVKIPSAAELGVTSRFINLSGRASTDSDKYAAGNVYSSLSGNNGYIPVSSHINPARAYVYSIREHHIKYNEVSTDDGRRYDVMTILLYYKNRNDGLGGFVDYDSYDIALLTPIIRF